ncbi:serine hydrolase-like protein isoform X1 [Homalodisca vitripennis]|uniref:serine hydrolase-like protein isoform X1 n=1 Tax=Homalodisca vitripennis TaxID=197043 RepID=UPI001EEC268C|nr:serine hydrolase-like protein isoform X1 [Homalodisca vitripennis]XP_046688406.1 serine hydrolase-like protein isoform X1 [Homalodisca vitripennis]
MPKSRKVLDISIPVPWGVIAGKTVGEESPIPILCVHGGSDNLETFAQLLPQLPANQYYVCIDLPGHGKSSHADKGYILDLVWYTLAVKRVIEYFRWPKLYYLGHSFGGQIGFLLSAFYPELVLKLVVIDTLMDYHISENITARTTRQYLFDTLLKLEKRSNLDEAPTYSFKEFVQKMKEARLTEVGDSQIKAMAERNLMKIGPDQYKFSNDQRNKLFGPIFFTCKQLESIAREISCPTLFILGKDSTNTKPLEKLNHTPMKKIRNAIFHVIEGDHDIHLARPEAVARLIVPFLSGEIISKL